MKYFKDEPNENNAPNPCHQLNHRQGQDFLKKDVGFTKVYFCTEAEEGGHRKG